MSKRKKPVIQEAPVTVATEYKGNQIIIVLYTNELWIWWKKNQKGYAFQCETLENIENSLASKLTHNNNISGVEVRIKARKTQNNNKRRT